MVAIRVLLLAAIALAHRDAALEDDYCALVQTQNLRNGYAAVGAIMSFSEFIVQHGRTYLPGSKEYTMRANLFEARVAKVQKQNSDSNREWTAGINKLADRTAEELKALRGYNRHRRASASAGSVASLAFTAFETPHHRSKKTTAMVSQLNWGDTLSALSEVQDQGGCGSCWAFAATTVMRAQSEIHASRRDFSPQEVVSCVRNSDHCGGDGGCEGATAELAMDYVLRYGAFAEEDFPYREVDWHCPSEILTEMQSDTAVHKGEAYGMVGWMRLPVNKLLPVKQALMSHGPLSVSIMVDDFFQMYQNGILPACRPEALINHAVALVGFGEESAASAAGAPRKFWRIQNSWGRDWGEEGYIRILRHEDSAEESHCGWDDQPEIGSGCDGGPERVWVCGACGILNDVVTPIFRGGPSHKEHHEPGANSKDVVLAQANATVTRH